MKNNINSTQSSKLKASQLSKKELVDIITNLRELLGLLSFNWGNLTWKDEDSIYQILRETDIEDDRDV